MGGDEGREPQTVAAAPAARTDRRTVWVAIKGDELTIAGAKRVLGSGWLDQEISLVGRPVKLREVRQYLGRLTSGDATCLGAALGKLLFPEVAGWEAVRPNPGESYVRMALDLDDAAGVVPWEYTIVNHDFLHTQSVIIVRHHKASVRHSGQLETCSVLVAYANPHKDFLADEHLARLEATFLANQFPPQIPVRNATLESLRERLTCLTKGQPGNPTVFHFLGHGKGASVGDAALVLCGVPPETEGLLYGGALNNQLQHGDFGLVVLGACYSGDDPRRGESGLRGMAKAIANTGRPVVAMQGAVPQTYSTDVLASFYTHLAKESFDVELALHKARHAAPEHPGQFGIPVLYGDFGDPESDVVPAVQEPGDAAPGHRGQIGIPVPGRDPSGRGDKRKPSWLIGIGIAAAVVAVSVAVICFFFCGPAPSVESPLSCAMVMSPVSREPAALERCRGEGSPGWAQEIELELRGDLWDGQPVRVRTRLKTETVAVRESRSLEFCEPTEHSSSVTPEIEEVHLKAACINDRVARLKLIYCGAEEPSRGGPIVLAMNRDQRAGTNPPQPQWPLLSCSVVAR